MSEVKFNVVKNLGTLADVVEAVGKDSVIIEQGKGKQYADDSSASDWWCILRCPGDIMLRITWSGYSPGYSEVTPGSPGYISFAIVEPTL